MGVFDSVADTILQGKQPTLDILVFLDFTSGPFRGWLGGFGNIVAGGQTWVGDNGVTKVTGLEAPIGATAPKVTFTLSGVDSTFVSRALNASLQVKGRDVIVYIQMFDNARQPVGSIFEYYRGEMDRMRGIIQGPSSSVLELTSETRWVRRGTPPWAWLSDRDQKRLWPGDEGLNQVVAMAQKTGGGWPLV